MSLAYRKNREAAMANDADWVADVRRWVAAAGQVKQTVPAAGDESEAAEVGYEAAYPALQAHDWVAGPRTDFTDL